jgi:hypothetical protein
MRTTNVRRLISSIRRSSMFVDFTRKRWKDRPEIEHFASFLPEMAFLVIRQMRSSHRTVLLRRHRCGMKRAV